MQDSLKVVTPHISPDLISTEAWFDICTLAQTLPSFWNAVLECRLGTGESRVDLSVILPNPTIALPDTLVMHPVWRRLENLCQDLADVNSSLHQMINEIWLEFDVDGQQSNVPIPAILLGLNQETDCNAQFLIETAQKLLAHSVSSNLKSNLQLCLDALPTDASIIGCIGAMLSRKCNAVRIIVYRIPPAQISAYLVDIGWTGSFNELEEVVTTVSPWVDNIVLSLDVGDTVFSRVGLEFYFKKLPKDKSCWQSFLEYLVTTGLCTPEKRNALLAWPGYEEKALSIFYRFITHIKIVYQPGIPLEAKGYLGIWHDRANSIN